MKQRSSLSLRFLRMSLLLVVLAGIGLGLLARHTVQAQLNQMAAALNEDAARVLQNTLWSDIGPLLDAPLNASRESLMSRMDYPGLRGRITAILAGSELVKIKVFNAQGFCVFSTDPSQIGISSPGHPAVTAALAGAVSSGMSYRGKFDALHGQIAQVDLFQSYIPIRADGSVVGVFEVYQNVTQTKEAANRSLRASLMVLCAVLSLLFMLQYLVVRRLERRLNNKEHLLATRNRELTVALDDAQRANLVKSEFISTVSHELRTPLTAIGGALGLVSGGAMGPLPPPVKNMLSIAHKNSQRLGLLINDLLDMEKLLAGKLHFDIQPMPLMPLVEQAIEDNQSIAAQHQVRFELMDRLDQVWVPVDGFRLQQVMSNLLSNAAKFSREGEVVAIHVREVGGSVRVEVRDRGPGVPEAFKGRIFQKFSQADASDTKQKGGTGLGLAISRELMERMGGRIDFESFAGEGACFFFDLPVCQAVPEASSTGTRLAHLRVLVVEDDVDVSSMLGAMLSRAGYTVDLATSGEEALRCLGSTAYAAMTLDLLLPDMSGQALIHQLRESPPTAELPIVVISAMADEAQHAMGTGVDRIEWLAKPIEPSRLLQGLERLLKPDQQAHPRVLHVEDDRELHEVVRAMAGDRFDFELATTLREARARVALERFDVVILDIGLPNESGWDLLPDIRHQQPGTRVVVLTGGAMTDAEGLEVDAVLQKSETSPQRLLEAIDARLLIKPIEEQPQ